jgi:hypothetical protein
LISNQRAKVQISLDQSEVFSYPTDSPHGKLPLWQYQKLCRFYSSFRFVSRLRLPLKLELAQHRLLSGRFVPALAIGISNSSWGIFASSTGVANQYYFQSNYQLSYYWIHNSGTMWGGVISPGFGVGAMYTVRSFKDEGSPLLNSNLMTLPWDRRFDCTGSILIRSI